MRTAGRIERAAMQAVARHSSATLEAGRESSDAYLVLAGKRIALSVTAIESRAPRRAKVAKPRLRFDRVALGLIDRLRATLSGSVPDGRTVAVTVTAPIRLPARTAAAMEEKIRKLLATRAAPTRLAGTVHGNKIQVHLLKGGSARTAKLIGFIHNPDSDPSILIDVARSLLARSGSGERTAGGRWLIVASRDDPAPIEACRQVCSQLGLAPLFEQVLVVLPEGRIAPLNG